MDQANTATVDKLTELTEKAKEVKKKQLEEDLKGSFGEDIIRACVDRASLGYYDYTFRTSDYHEPIYTYILLNTIQEHFKQLGFNVTSNSDTVVFDSLQFGEDVFKITLSWYPIKLDIKEDSSLEATKYPSFLSVGG